MDEYLNDTYQIIPQMQEKVLFHNKKLKTFDDFISQYGEIIDKLTKSNEDFEKKLNEINSKTQDINLADVLKANVADMEGEEGQNNLALNLITKLESKFNEKIKAIEARLNKLEESNFKFVKDIQNIKNAQDLSKRNINAFKQSIENIVTNLRTMEAKISKIGPELEHKIEVEKIIKEEKPKEEVVEAQKKEENEKGESFISMSRKSEPQIDLENNE